VLKVKFPGVGLIRRATGTTNPKTFAAIRRMCAVLYDAGRLDLLEALATGRIHPMVMLERFRAGRLETLPSADVLPALVLTLQSWIDQATGSEETRRGRRNVLVIMQRLAPTGTIGELPDLLRTYRAHAAAHPRAFNLARATLQAFLRDHLGKSHALYAALSDVPALKYRPSRRGRPFSPDQLRGLMKAMGHPHGLMAWTMATTGMGPKEYWEDGFDVLAHGVAIHGQKRASRERVVPRVSVTTEPQVSRGRWQIRFRQHAPGHSPYDLRRTFSNLLVEAGLPANRRQHYMGHGPRSMTELYEQPEILRWLAEDGAALRRVLGEPEAGLRIIHGGRA
jgi:integrase